MKRAGGRVGGAASECAAAGQPIGGGHAGFDDRGYRQPVSQAGIESVRGTSSDSAIGTLLQRQLIALDDHRLFTTTPAFLKYLGLRDLADLPPLPELEAEGGIRG